MNTSIRIKSVLANTFDYLKIIERYISKKAECRYLILMYHRVLPFSDAEKGIQGGMYVNPESFNMQIDYLKNNFNIITFSNLFSNIIDKSPSMKEPTCVLTFDDGWYDFYKYAYPILETQKVPATVFLPTRYIGTESLFWTDEVANYFIKEIDRNNTNNKENITDNVLVNIIMSLKGSTNIKIEKAISILKSHKDDVILRVLTELNSTCGIGSKLSTRAFLNWDEVRKMAGTNLITFGSHTENHKMLNFLKDSDIYEELMQSKIKLLSEKIVDLSFLPFSYPNGNYDNRVIKILKETGYHVAVTTENGWNHPSTPRFNLKRVGIHQDISSTKAMFGCRIANLF